MWIRAVTPVREDNSLRFGVQPQVTLEHGGTGPKSGSRQDRSTWYSGRHLPSDDSCPVRFRHGEN